MDHELRHATMRNHTATHLLHAALRERLGTHVRQAGSAVRPDKLRFDFTHGAPLGAEEVRAIEDRINGWVKASRPVRALEMERAEAEAMGAMALFGEKYGDWVRVIEVDDVSRELCGGTHVANTAEIGIVALVSEGSSAANVRRIEALIGPRRDRLVPRPLGPARARRASCWARAATRLTPPAAQRSGSPSSRNASPKSAASRPARRRIELAGTGEVVGGITLIVARADGDPGRLRDLADQVRQREGDAAVVLGGTDDGKAALVASFSPGAVERGASAVEILREAAACDRRRRRRTRPRPRRRAAATPSASTRRSRQPARRWPERFRRVSARMRVLAIDHGDVRAGTAICDPSGTIVRPLGVVSPPDAGEVARIAAEEGAELLVVGMPVSLDGAEREQATAARAFADELRAATELPVETYDERLTTRMAAESARGGAEAPADALAAAHLLESYLASRKAGP